MRLRCVLVVSLLSSTAAHAHFRFLLADGGTIDWLNVDTQGDPVGTAGLGQKTNPCGSGTESGRVTNVIAGQPYGIRIQETIMHPGHYRVAIGPNPALFPAPMATNTPTSCFSTTLASGPPYTLPVLVDNALNHTNTFGGPQTITVTVPANNGYGLQMVQVVEWMQDHGQNSCFYFHCARVNVLLPDGGNTLGTGGGAGTGGGTAGTGGGSGTGGGTAATGGGSGTGGGTAATGGGSGTGGGTSAVGGGTGAGVDEGGCQCGGSGAGALVLLVVFPFTLGRSRRRRVEGRTGT